METGLGRWMRHANWRLREDLRECPDRSGEPDDLAVNPDGRRDSLYPAACAASTPPTCGYGAIPPRHGPRTGRIFGTICRRSFGSCDFCLAIPDIPKDNAGGRRSDLAPRDGLPQATRAHDVAAIQVVGARHSWGGRAVYAGHCCLKEANARCHLNTNGFTVM
jgi:hypothetical protein